MTHQIFIASYPKDYLWLQYCLKSLVKFSTGFLPPVVCLPSADPEGISTAQRYGAEFKVWPGHGMARAQVAMLHADEMCPKADYVYLLGSDCLAFKPFRPMDYWHDGKPLMLYNSYAHLDEKKIPAVCWKRGTQEALGGVANYEFMRRLPIVYPRVVFLQTRDQLRTHRGPAWTRYVENVINTVNNFSESNVLGEVAWRHLRSRYTWENRDHPTLALPENPIAQFWSHGGMDWPNDRVFVGETSRSVIERTVGL